MLWRIVEITVYNDQANETVRPSGEYELVDMIRLLFKCLASILTLDNKEKRKCQTGTCMPKRTAYFSLNC